MKREKDVEQEVLKITMRIHREFPELSKFLEEMPETIFNSDTDVINLKNMQEYYNSLVELIAKYSKTHKK